MEQPLSGVKILDLTGYIAGPYCTKLLADYGADVIKVENPDGGDPARKLGPFFNDEPHPEKSGLFLYLNTNKRGITLNLETETGRRIFNELAEHADILVESFSPRVMPSLGLGYENMGKINPGLVMTSISDFGQTGPYRDFKGSELIYQGYGGPMYLTGTDEGGPLKRGGNIIQYQVGSVAAVATMVAFYGAEMTGRGDHVDIDASRAELISIDSK
ncbi:CaiB/BaiF CoA transferase family protein, partial [Thermodesulfobacteriota bacterium]